MGLHYKSWLTLQENEVAKPLGGRMNRSTGLQVLDSTFECAFSVKSHALRKLVEQGKVLHLLFACCSCLLFAESF